MIILLLAKNWIAGGGGGGDKELYADPNELIDRRG